jgi:AraC family transcriptional activator of mtrCDE
MSQVDWLSHLLQLITVRTMESRSEERNGSASDHPASLVGLMRMECAGNKPGRYAVLNALTSALFTLALRAASESEQAPAGLLALAGDPRLAPAISAMFVHPAHPWRLPDLANLWGMSSGTFMRHFRDKLGNSALGFLIEIRISLAASELMKPAMTTESAAKSVGYQSVAAFRRVFTDRMGMTLGQWRRLTREGEV